MDTNSPFRFSIRFLLLIITVSAVAVYCWPKPLKPGQPNLVGRVTDENGNPIANVRIMLYGGVATRWRIGETKTDQNGRYSFKPVPNGELRSPESSDGFAHNYVGISIPSDSNLVSDDQEYWWDVSIPMIEGHEYRKDFRMIHLLQK